ncbi:MAG: VWA domain-containing protein, partial [Acidobacteriota bacterium]|nr:VWA domain-containing protein [Acidobacteriota bacterium]
MPKTLRAAASIALVAVALTSGSTGRAQDQGQPPVTFKVEVNYVEIDAVVTDSQGRPVTDLKKDEFQVSEGGTAQSITAFSRVDVPIERADPPLFRRTVVKPDVQSNRDAFTGRVFLLVLDDLQTDFRRTSRVQAAARHFIRRYMGANDMVAVMTTGGTAAAAQEFTSSQTRLIAAIDRFMGRKSMSGMVEMERAMNARNTYETLRGIADFLGPVRGRRKAILWFGEGVEYDIIGARDSDAVRNAMQSAITAATRANVTIYGIDPRGVGAGLDEAIELTPGPDENNPMGSVFDAVRRGQDSLRSVSDSTGGFAAVNRNDLNDVFTRIIQENSSYYVLGYYPASDRRDGRFRAVDVRVTRPGLTVRARKGYVAPAGKPPSPGRDGLDASIPGEIRAALASPIPTRDLPLAMFAAPFAGVRPKASVALVLEIDGARLPFVEKDGLFTEDLEIHVLAIDAAGKVRAGGRDTVPMRLRGPNRDAVVNHGLRITRRLDLAPGRYQIHVAVREANRGALGTVRQDLDVPDFGKGALHMSGLALTSTAVDLMPTANPDPGFKAVLPSPATATREFARGDTLALFSEIYDNQTVRHKVGIKTSVLAGDGHVVFTASDERSTDELQGKKGGYGYT